MKQVAFFFLALLIALPSYALQPIEKVSHQDINAWLVRDDAVPAFDMQLSFTHAGSAYDPQDQQGLAELAAMMLQEGTQQRDAHAFAEALESKAIELSVSVSDETLSVHVKSLSDQRDAAFDLLYEMLTHAAVNAQRLADAKQRLNAQRKRQEESPYFHAAVQWWKSGYGDHPFGRSGYGTQASIANITAEDIRDFYAQRLNPQRLRISAAGDLAVAPLRKLLKRLGHLNSAAPAPALPEATWQATVRDTHVTLDVPQTVIQFGGPGVTRNDPDFFAAFVMNHVIGGGSLTSVLGEAVRKDKGYTYGINTGLGQKGDTAYWSGRYATAQENAQASVALVKATLQKVAQQGVSDAQVKQAKDYLTGSFFLQLDRNRNLVSYLNSMQRFRLGMDYLEKRNDYINRVTTQDVNRVAKRLLNAEHLLYVVAGQREENEE